MRSKRLLRLGTAAALLLLLAPTRGVVGGLGVPCDPGSFSASGFRPCNLCLPGTCIACGCDDHTACTLDRCDAVTASCSAEPVPSCQLASIAFSGTVTHVDTTSSNSLVSLGMPIEGHVLVDPLAPDENPVSPNAALYLALKDFDMRVGPDPPTLEVAALVGTVEVDDNVPGIGDAYQISTSTLLVHNRLDVTANYFVLTLEAQGSTGPITSDALFTEPPDPAAFALAQLDLEVVEPTGTTTLRSEDFVLTAPEPPARGVALAAAAALFALARQRRARGDRSGRRTLRGDAGAACH